MSDGQHAQQDHITDQGDIPDRDCIPSGECVPIGESNTPLRALESAQSYVARSAATSCTCDGSSTSFAASFKAVLDWGEANALIRPEGDFLFFQRVADGFGDEHEGWFDEASNRWFKATYHNQFGLAWGRTGSATVGEYLTRLLLQNHYFGDDIQLVALIESRQKLRVLTSQPHVAGEAALYEDIHKWFCGLGFCRLEASGSIAWYLKSENLLVADAHEGNVIRTERGTLVPIDLNLMQPHGKMLAWVDATLQRCAAAAGGAENR